MSSTRSLLHSHPADFVGMNAGYRQSASWTPTGLPGCIRSGETEPAPIASTLKGVAFQGIRKLAVHFQRADRLNDGQVCEALRKISEER